MLKYTEDIKVEILRQKCVYKYGSSAYPDQSVLVTEN